MSITREFILENLKEELVVVFVKSNGEERSLKCTQNESLMNIKQDEPEEELIKNPIERKVNLDQIRVYDLENNGWRSFNINSVKYVYKNRELIWQ